MACDTWYVTGDTWWGMNILSKVQLPRSYGLGYTLDSVLKILNERITQSMKEYTSTPGLLITVHEVKVSIRYVKISANNKFRVLVESTVLLSSSVPFDEEDLCKNTQSRPTRGLGIIPCPKTLHCLTQNTSPKNWLIGP